MIKWLIRIIWGEDKTLVKIEKHLAKIACCVSENPYGECHSLSVKDWKIK